MKLIYILVVLVIAGCRTANNESLSKTEDLNIVEPKANVKQDTTSSIRRDQKITSKESSSTVEKSQVSQFNPAAANLRTLKKKRRGIGMELKKLSKTDPEWQKLKKEFDALTSEIQKEKRKLGR